MTTTPPPFDTHSFGSDEEFEDHRPRRGLRAHRSGRDGSPVVQFDGFGEARLPDTRVSYEPTAEEDEHQLGYYRLRDTLQTLVCQRPSEDVDLFSILLAAWLIEPAGEETTLETTDLLLALCAMEDRLDTGDIIASVGAVGTLGTWLIGEKTTRGYRLYAVGRRDAEMPQDATDIALTQNSVFRNASVFADISVDISEPLLRSGLFVRVGWANAGEVERALELGHYAQTRLGRDSLWHRHLPFEAERLQEQAQALSLAEHLWLARKAELFLRQLHLQTFRRTVVVKQRTAIARSWA